MAKPIKETPILTGKDASSFTQEMKKADVTRVNINERTKIRQNFALLQAIAKF